MQLKEFFFPALFVKKQEGEARRLLLLAKQTVTSAVYAQSVSGEHLKSNTQRCVLLHGIGVGIEDGLEHIGDELLHLLRSTSGINPAFS